MTNRFLMMILSVSGIVMATSLCVYGQESYPLKIQLSGPAGKYDLTRWKQDWPGCKFEDGVTEGRTSLVESSDLKWLRVTCKADEIGPEQGGIGWRKPIPPTGRLELAYRVQFAEDFDFAKGGKLPGLAGGPDSVTGGRPANGKNGFSARFMWREDGRAEAYVYHMDQPGKYGESFPFSDDFRIPRGKPFMLIMRIDMNEVGQADGALEAWVKVGEEDAIKVIQRYDLRWRDDESIQIDSLMCQVFHGGNDASWAPKKDCTVDLADFQMLE